MGASPVRRCLMLGFLVVAGVWMNILQPVEKMRREADLVKMFPTYVTGEELFGLNEPAILRIVESVSFFSREFFVYFPPSQL